MSQAESILEALGGWENITDIQSCITRIRVEVVDDERVNEEQLREAGAFGVVVVGANVQVVMGPQAEEIATSIEDLR